VAVDLCEGVDCDDQNDCTDDTCDPADGSCSNTAVDNGTACNGDAGMCVDGTCVETDLCEGVTCDDTGNDCTVAMCNMQNGECEVMDAPDGTECNGGAGACSAGVCLDNSLCDGVDCTSANDCVQDGSCDPASGECIPGSNEPVDTACTEGGVCDGQGDCVECNSAAQCADDGNECTAAACDSNTCSTGNVADGTSCDGGNGQCMSGVCEAAMLCEGVNCSDGNECTNDLCDPADGSCSNPAVADGTSCDGGNGQCMSGSCEAIDLCEGVTCDDGNECTADGCDSATGECTYLPDPGASCDGGNGTCDGAGNCQSNGVDPDPKSAVLTLGCKNNVTADVSILPFSLTVDPATIAPSSLFTADLSGIAEFSEVFLDAAQGAVPGGVTQANLVDLNATVHVRSGAVGGDVTLNADAALPYTCALDPLTSCDPANDAASVPGNRGNTDCVPTGFFNACGRFVTVPTTTDQATCTSLGKSAQWDTNGFCVTGGLPLNLEPDTGSYTADASGTVLFGWDDESTGATIAGNGTWTLPAAVFTNPTGPNGIRVNASGLSVALECTMGVDSGGPNGVSVPDGASPTPDSLLIPFDI
jgi:hypothetical protein